MGRSFFVLFLLLSFYSLKAQITTPPPNMKITDIYGNYHNLYTDMLSEGKYVFVDFFTNTCTFCQYYAPIVDSVYRFFGCGCNNIDFWALNKYSGSDNQSVMDFAIRYGISFTPFSADGGSAYVSDIYNVPYTPYFILIAPDTSLAMDNPQFENAQELIDTLLAIGLTPSECTGTNFYYFELRTATDTFLANINTSEKHIIIQVTDTSDISQAKGFFIVSSNAEVFIDGQLQISDSTINDFSNGLIYTVQAQAGNQEQWQVIIQRVPTYVHRGNRIVYPNPTQAILNIPSEFIGGYYRIYNSEGRLLLMRHIKKSQIDLFNLQPGIYYLMLEKGTYIKNYKIMKH